jgi:FAD/FMN-containing dehydrogenase
MKRAQVDPVKCIAWTQAGLTLGELIRETQAFGLALPVGTASDTGLSGLTLGGGMGWLMGKYGLTIDSLLAVEMVTADGCVLRASADEHADLFWAVRGGGGNFGVVTSFLFRLHQVGTLLAGMLYHSLSRAREVLRLYREVTRTAPDELTAYAGFVSMPDGRPAVALALCYCGSSEEGERLVAPLRSFGPPLVDLVRPMSYLELVSMSDAGVPRGRHYYNKARSLTQLDEQVLETIIEFGSSPTSPLTTIALEHVHGAACRVGVQETAFALREEHYALHMLTAWDEGAVSEADTHIGWTRALWAATEPFAAAETYANYLEDEGEARVRASYGANYERLVNVKNTYDPTNVFRINHNIKPTVK